MFFCEHIPRTETAGSYGRLIFSFLRNLHIVLHNDCTTLNSNQSCRRVPLSPHPLQHFCLFVFRLFDDGHCDWCEVIRHCIFLMISDVEHLYMYFWAICLFWRSMSGSFAHFLSGLLFWYQAAWTVCIFWWLIPCWSLCLQIFSHILLVLFLFSFTVQKLLSSIRSCLLILFSLL